MGITLLIVEVSQKQAYIFGSNKLRENIQNSRTIAWITGPDFFRIAAGGDPALFDEERNLVYSGGGHTVLEFQDHETARRFTGALTREVLVRFPDLEMFASLMDYREDLTPQENLKELSKLLEKKKSLRRASFHKGIFGIEEIDTNSQRPRRVSLGDSLKEMPEEDPSFTPPGFQAVKELRDLGVSEGESSFVAIVHIDGNGMGRRVTDFYNLPGMKSLSFEEFRKKIRKFSDDIDKDFKDAYREMAESVAESPALEELSLRNQAFPIRRIITSGDDICFIAEGRIGVSAAKIFLDKLSAKKNASDGKHYHACAGVAIVHEKYPFYRAYELAEALCSSAKRTGAFLSPEDNGASVSLIDWHIEFGELGDSLEKIRAGYSTREGKRLELRPYIVEAPGEILEREACRRYDCFRQVMCVIRGDEGSRRPGGKENSGGGGEKYPRGKLKELRSVLKGTEMETKYYLRFNGIEILSLESAQRIFLTENLDRLLTGQGQDRTLFVRSSDGVERSTVFDALELMDTYLDLEKGGGEHAGTDAAVK